MRDAIGGSLLLNLVIIFTSIVILFFAGIITYSKAYKVKNRIIEVIEKYENYDINVANIITEELQNTGYRTSTYEQIMDKCGSDSLSLQYGAGHLYCVYLDNSSNNGYSYRVVTYIHFDFPVIGSALNLPVKGETKILGKNYNY